jgi:lysine biosynthesis protein LysW
MLKCVECGTAIDLSNHEEGTVIDCPECYTELELVENRLIGLHLGPSEE